MKRWRLLEKRKKQQEKDNKTLNTETSISILKSLNIIMNNLR
jgi:hypothetical protein